jgi:hypothetical protein
MKEKDIGAVPVNKKIVFADMEQQFPKIIIDHCGFDKKKFLILHERDKLRDMFKQDSNNVGGLISDQILCGDNGEYLEDFVNDINWLLTKGIQCAFWGNGKSANFMEDAIRNAKLNCQVYKKLGMDPNDIPKIFKSHFGIQKSHALN